MKQNLLCYKVNKKIRIINPDYVKIEIYKLTTRTSTIPNIIRRVLETA